MVVSSATPRLGREEMYGWSVESQGIPQGSAGPRASRGVEVHEKEKDRVCRWIRSISGELMPSEGQMVTPGRVEPLATRNIYDSRDRLAKVIWER